MAGKSSPKPPDNLLSSFRGLVHASGDGKRPAGKLRLPMTGPFAQNAEVDGLAGIE